MILNAMTLNLMYAFYYTTFFLSLCEILFQLHFFMFYNIQ